MDCRSAGLLALSAGVLSFGGMDRFCAHVVQFASRCSAFDVACSLEGASGLAYAGLQVQIGCMCGWFKACGCSGQASTASIFPSELRQVL